MTDRWIFLGLGAAITFFLAAINFRLGILNELKKDFKEFKDYCYNNFITENTCNLKRKACDKHD